MKIRSIFKRSMVVILVLALIPYCGMAQNLVAAGLPPGLASYASFSRFFYVSPTGNDSAEGTSAAPFKTINKAVNLSTLRAGDCIIVKPGTYTEQVTWNTKGGNASNSIALVSETMQGALIRPPQGTYSTVHIATNYVIIDGFDIVGGSGHAIDIESAHHISVLNNYTHDSEGSGISAQHGEYYTFDGNVSYNNSSLNGFQTSGISVYQARAISGDTTSTGFRIIIRNNISYNNIETYPSSDRSHTDGNGIIIDDFQQTQTTGFPIYPYPTLVENNLVYGNGGKGIQVTWSDHVTVRNNTSYHNNLDNLNGGTWRGELNNQQSSDNQWINNIAVANPSVNQNNTAIGNLSYGSYINENVIWLNNLTFNGSVGNSSLNISSGNATPTTTNGNILGMNPLFVAPGLLGTSDFHTQSASPAINKGTSTYGVAETDLDGNPRVAGVIDIGSYESSNAPSDTTPPSIPAILQASAVSATQVNLSWTASTDNVSVVGYKIYRDGIQVGTASTTTYTDTGLVRLTTYSYTVSAYDAAGNNSSKSQAVSVKTMDVPPAAPTDLKLLIVTANWIRVSWIDNSNKETGFKVERKTGAQGSYEQIALLVANKKTYTSTRLTPNTQYFYRIRATNASGDSGYSNEITGTTLSRTP